MKIYIFVLALLAISGCSVADNVFLSPAQSKTCYDYTAAFEAGPIECTAENLYNRFFEQYELQSEQDKLFECSGGITQELQTLAGQDDWESELLKLCNDNLLEERVSIVEYMFPGPSQSKTCYDYTAAFEVKPIECTVLKLYRQIHAEYKRQSKQEWAQKWYCRGGLTQELLTLTNKKERGEDWRKGLQEMCDSTLLEEATKLATGDWSSLENAGIDFDDFYKGRGFLNEEIGNFQQNTSEFLKRGGCNRFNYVGTNPRKNDHYPTTRESFRAGKAVEEFNRKRANSSFLDRPSDIFEADCGLTNTFMCCWGGDRQYFDNNGGCTETSCAKKTPEDNTDLCWVEDDEGGDPWPYPGQAEGNLFCKGFHWPSIATSDDFSLDDYVNNAAKWNTLFYVSMHEAMYTKGYVKSITLGLGGRDQPMCGCVEDMAPVARADCTEAVGRANFTARQDFDTGLLVMDVKPKTFSLEFQPCEGYDYKPGLTPKRFKDELNLNPLSAKLRPRNNDLSAYIYRQYLEGKTGTEKIESYKKTVVGYDTPSVNTGDRGHEQSCQRAFEERYPGRPYVERGLPPTVCPTNAPTNSPTSPRSITDSPTRPSIRPPSLSSKKSKKGKKSKKHKKGKKSKKGKTV